MMHPPRHFSKVADGQHSICHTLQYLQWREKYNTLNTGASHGVAWVWLCLQPFVFLSQFHIEFRLLVWGKKTHLFFPLEESITIAIDLPFFTFSSSCRDIFTRPCFFFEFSRTPLILFPQFVLCTIVIKISAFSILLYLLSVFPLKCFFSLFLFLVLLLFLGYICLAENFLFLFPLLEK